MITVSGTVLDIWSNFSTSVGSISANWLSSVLTIFLQFLPAILVFSALVYLLPSFVSWLFANFNIWLWSKLKKTDSSSFEQRQSLQSNKNQW